MVDEVMDEAEDEAEDEVVDEVAETMLPGRLGVLAEFDIWDVVGGAAALDADSFV